jgi:hypothetical protein
MTACLRSCIWGKPAERACVSTYLPQGRRFSCHLLYARCLQLDRGIRFRPNMSFFTPAIVSVHTRTHALLTPGPMRNRTQDVMRER